MHGGINKPPAVSFYLQLSFRMCDIFLPPCIKGLIIVASLLKINFNKYFFLIPNSRLFRVLYGRQLK